MIEKASHSALVGKVAGEESTSSEWEWRQRMHKVQHLQAYAGLTPGFFWVGSWFRAWAGKRGRWESLTVAKGLKWNWASPIINCWPSWGITDCIPDVKFHFKLWEQT